MSRPTIRTLAPQAHRPYQPPMAHLVHIASPYVPACATNVQATIDRVRGQVAAQLKTRRRPAAKNTAQGDLFDPMRANGTVVCIAAVQRRKAA